MDIVYPLKNCNICEELIYSLRSLRNLPHDKIFFVGGCPNNIRRDNIIYISNTQTSTKWKNSTENLKVACRDERLSDDFILMNDDFFILKPISNVVEELALDFGLVNEVYRRYVQKGLGFSSYNQGMKATEQFLKNMGIQKPLSFELHLPMIINKKKFLDMFKLPGIEHIPVLHKRTLYGNLYCRNTTTRKDVKILNKDKFSSYEDKFLSSSDASWKKVKPFLESLFPEKSIHEF